MAVGTPKTRMLNGQRIDIATGKPYVPTSIRNLQMQGGDQGASLSFSRDASSNVAAAVPNDLGGALMSLLQKYQQLGTRPFVEQGLNAQQEQVNRISAKTPADLIGAAPGVQSSVRSASAGALDPTIQGARSDAQTFTEQIQAGTEQVKSLYDFVKNLEAQQDKERDDARAILGQAITNFGAQAFDIVDPKLVKIAGYNDEQVKTAKQTLKEQEMEQKAQIAAQRASERALVNGLTNYQATQVFNGIVGKYNASPLIEAADRTPVLKNAIANARQNPTDGALQLNLAYSYIQALDTYQSAVREGELSLVNSIDSKVGQIQNFAQKIINGQILREDAVKQIAGAAEQVLGTIETAAANKARSFQSQAEVAGVGSQFNQYLQGFQPSYGGGGGSTVMIGGKSVPVGSVITNSKGQRAKVNADGTVTPI